MDAINLDMTQVKNAKIAEAVLKDRAKLLNFIRKRVSDQDEAEDILQDVFFQLTQGYDMIGSLDKLTSWMYTVARNKITDLYRKKKPERFNVINADDDEGLSLENLLPAFGNTPEDVLFKSVIWDAITEALDELPVEQRDVFVKNEFEDISFKELSKTSGVSVNTLLSRKRYAVLHLRSRLKNIYEELNY